MKNAIKIFIAYILAASFAAACLMLFPILKTDDADSGGNPVYELRSAYRRSCAVIKAKCVQSYIMQDGSYRSKLSVEEVLAGDRALKAGRIITVVGKNEPNNEMIVYLNKEKNLSFFNDVDCYFPVDDAMYPLDGEKVELAEDKTVSIDDIKSDIVKLETQLMTPSKFLFYNDIKSVVESSDLIFIGEVVSVSLYKDADLFTELRGEELHRKGMVFDIEVRVKEGIIRRYEGGSTVTIKYIGDAYDNTYYEKTGEHFYNNANIALPRVGDVCMFFVKEGPDKKTDDFFLINSYQGIIKTVNKTVIPHPVNVPFAKFNDLDDMIRAMFEAIGFSMTSFFSNK